MQGEMRAACHDALIQPLFILGFVMKSRRGRTCHLPPPAKIELRLPGACGLWRGVR